MATDHKFKVKNGLQTQNISFVDADTTNTITATMSTTDTLSFSGGSGQLFSISDSLSGTIFAVNDVSGMPSIEVDDDGTIRLAETSGNILIGKSTDDGSNKLQIDGNITATNITATNITNTGNFTSNGNLLLDSTGYNYIELHSSATNTRKWRFYNGQHWNQDALLIYDQDSDSTVLTLETNKLGVNRGAASLSHNLDVGGNIAISGTEIVTSARNLTNIGTITSGAITTSGNLSLSGDSRKIEMLDGTTNSQPSIAIGEQSLYGFRQRWDSGQKVIFEGWWSSSTSGAVNRDFGHLDLYTKKWRFNDYVGINVDANTTYRLYVNGNIRADGNYYVGGQTVIDSSRNLTNIGTISSGVLTVAGASGGRNLSYASNFAASGAGIQLTLERTSDSTGWGGIGADATYCFSAWGGSGGVVRRFGIGQSGDANLFYGGYQINSTTVIDSSRNLTNIGTISSGAITSSGKISASNDLETATRLKFTNNITNGWSAPIIFRESAYLALSDYSGVKLGGYNGTSYGPRVHVSGTGNLNILEGNLMMAGTTVIDSSRNLTNIGTISSGAITSSGNIGAASGHVSGKFAVKSTGVHNSYDFYNNGTSYFNGTTEVNAELKVSSGSAYTTHLNYQDNGQNFISQATSGGLTQIRNSQGTLLEVAASGNVSIANDLTVSGNFSVLGTTTTLNTATLQVEDKNIVLNYGTGDTSSTANGAGITIQDAVNSTTNATIEWSQAGGNFNVSHGWNSLGYLQHAGVLYSRNNLLVLNSAGNGWNTWATRSNGQFNLSVGTISSGAITTTTGAITVRYGSTPNISLTPTSTGGVINARNSSGTSVVVMDARGTPFLDVTGDLKTSGTVRINSSGNATLGTISSGAITSSGNLNITGAGNGILIDNSSGGANIGIGEGVRPTNSVGHTASDDEGIFWHTDSSNDYGIYRTAGSWSSPSYQKLRIRWPVGIELDGGNSTYTNYGVNLVSSSPLRMNGNIVIDSSRNITAGTISSGAITSSSTVQGTAYLVGSTVIVNTNRDLTNIGTISSGAITSSGIVSGTAFVGGLYGGATGATDARIWAVSASYPNYGIFYNEGNPDSIDFRWNGVDKLKINLENGLVNSVTGFQINAATVIDSSRNLTNIANLSSTINGNNSTGGNIVLGATGNNATKWHAITARQYNNSTEAEGYSLITGATNSGVNNVTIGGGLDEQNAATTVAIKAAANSSTRNGTEIVRITTDGFDIRNNVLRITGTEVINASRDVKNVTLKGSTGGARLEASQWHQSSEGQQRFYFSSNSNTYLGTGNSFIFRNSNDSGTASINGSGQLRLQTSSDQLSIGAGLQVGNHTFTGANGVYQSSRLGVMLNGALKSYVYASTYNDSNYPDYGFVFIHGPSTSSYNVWSISPDGPAKGDSLNFIYGSNATNIHTTTPKVVFDGNGDVILNSGDLTVSDFVKASGNNLKFSAGGNHIMNIDLNGKIYPQTDNSVDLGFSSSAARFRHLNLSGNITVAGSTVIDSSRNLTNIGTYSGAGDVVAQAANVMFHARSSADGQTVGYRAGYQNHTSLQAFFRYTTGDAQLYIDNDFTGNNGLYSNINFRNKANGGSSLINRMTIHGSTGHVNITGGYLQMGGTTVIDSSRNVSAGTVTGSTFTTGAINASGEIKSTSTSAQAIKTRFIAGAANGSTSDGPLYLQYGRGQDIRMFENSSQNRVLYIYGNDNGTDRWGSLSVGTDGSFNVTASDTYLLLNAASYIQSNRPHNFTSSLLTSGVTWLDSSRNATFNSLHTDFYEDAAGTFLFRKGATSGTTRHLNLANTTADPSNIDDTDTTGITWGQRTDSQPYYMIYVDRENYGGYNHSRLRLNWHTGIQIGASSTYGGTRFYNDARRGTGGGDLIFSVGNTDNNVRVAYNAYVAGNLYLGDGNDGYFYNDTNGRTAFANGDFYIQNSVGNYYNYATNQYMGDSSGDNIFFRGNSLTGDSWSLNGAGVLHAQSFRLGNTSAWKIRPNGGNSQLAFEYSTSSSLADTSIKAELGSGGDFIVGDRLANKLSGYQIELKKASTSIGDGGGAGALNLRTTGNFYVRHNGYDSLTFASNGLQKTKYANGSNAIYAEMLSTDTLSFTGDSGQLFSISDSLSGTIFSVNDVSGMPSIEVEDDGTIYLAETAGNVLIGRNSDNGSKVQIGRSDDGNLITADRGSNRTLNIGYKVPYGGNTYFTTANFGLQMYQFSTSKYIAPCDNTGANHDDLVDLGVSGSRFDDIYATNGTIQTSDRNEKQDIQALTDAETRVATACKSLIRRYRWISSVEEKGDDARYHFGAIAQDVEAAFTAEGLDAGDYALFISSTWWEHEGESYPTAEAAPTGAVEKTRLGIRYNQLFAFIISAL